MDEHSLDRLDFPRVRTLLSEYACSGLGRALALAIRPSQRVDLIRRWLDQVSELKRWVSERGMPPFAGIYDIRDSVARCTPPLHVTVDEVAQIGRTLAGTHEIVGYFANLPPELNELRHIAERIGDFRTVADRIAAVIDDRGQIRDSASPRIARLRREIQDATDQIVAVVERLLHDAGVRRLLQYPNHTFFNDRLVLPLKTEYRGRLSGIVHRSSDSGATLYVEPAAAVELNNRITNLRSEEADEVARLLWELAHEIHINSEPILRTIDALAVLDLATAKLRMAQVFELRCPALSESAIVIARQARHPLLLDLVRRKREAGEPANEVVPINYRLGDDFDMLIITGPNTGGKTVTLKTIGLLSLMVQAGMPAPVDEGSVFGVFREIFIDIGDEQDMQQSLSTFSAHLTRQMETLKRVNEQTLVLLDELGAGTDPDEGAAIGRALLDELLRMKSKCIATTHLGALKSFPLQRERVENGCVEFDVESLRPTYKLVIGEPGMSNAIAIAERLGMPKRLVHAARNNLSRGHRVFHTALRDTVAAKRQAEQARDAAESARLNLDRKQSETDAARTLLERQQADFQQWVQRVVHLQPGDMVRVRGFDRDGKIVRVRMDLQRAEVDVGSFSVEVPLGDILPPQTPAPPARPAPPPRLPAPPNRPAKPVGPSARSEAGARSRNSTQPRDAATPHDGRRSGPDGERGAQRAGRDARPPQRPKPEYPPLTDEQISKLSVGGSVYVKRFHREGVLVRLMPDRKLAVVSVGLLEVEVPFNGLAIRPG